MSKPQKTRPKTLHLVPLKNAYLLLVKAPVVLKRCPSCGDKPFMPFVRGQVHRGQLRALAEKFLAVKQKRTAQCWALICRRCKDVVAYEDAQGVSASSERLNAREAEKKQRRSAVPRHVTFQVHASDAHTTDNPPTSKEKDAP